MAQTEHEDQYERRKVNGVEVVKHRTLESRESKIEAVLAYLREQGVGEDWIDKIISEANQMLEGDPVVAHVRNQAMLALAAKRKAEAVKPPSNGVADRINALTFWLWDSRLIDHFVADLRHDERLIEVKGFALITNLRNRTRAELKQACRYVTELNDQMFERNFTSDQAVREVEARQAQREQPPQYGRQLDRPWSARG